MDVLRRIYWEKLLSIEGEVASEYADLEDGDEVVFVDDLYGTDEDD